MPSEWGRLPPSSGTPESCLPLPCLSAFTLLLELLAVREPPRERERVARGAEGSVRVPWVEAGCTPASDSGTSKDLPSCHLPLGCSSNAAAPHHPHSIASRSSHHSWCCVGARVVPQLPGQAFSLRKGLPGPRCVHGEQQWGQGMARRPGYGWQAGGCLCRLGGALVSEGCLSPVLAWSLLKGARGNKR